MEATVEALPKYLRRYVVKQSPAAYTARDHAAWRFIMRQSRAFFKDHALPIYLEGLEKTGITTDRIPQISEMNAKLQHLGWGAVPVRGFIPPAAFLDFQSRRILPIAADMRSAEHIDYTPAPDIVHEAAGHAPILADPDYSDYLTKYAQMAQKAIFAKEDLDLYEAIRALSDIKENPDSTPTLLEHAQKKLDVAVRGIDFISEANKTARMNWWTVEYGLIGDMAKPKIYGAGLLSSVGESRNCLSPQVRKIRLSAACTETSYDITEPQPQLFVAESIPHLCSVLDEFDKSLAYRRGGIYGMDQALRGGTVTSTVLDSGLQISGRLVEYIADGETIEYAKWAGPVQLCVNDKQLPGQGIAQHPEGFSTPLGLWKNKSNRHPANLSQADLNELNLTPGSKAKLEFLSGFVVSGEVVNVFRHEGVLQLIKWRNCHITRGAEVYFEPSWGEFDMPVGSEIPSVFGGSADREAFGVHEVGEATTSPSRESPYTDKELATFSRYANLRELREQLRSSPDDPQVISRLVEFISQCDENITGEWLLRLECIELISQLPESYPKKREYRETAKAELLKEKNNFEPKVQWLIDQGLSLATVTP